MIRVDKLKRRKTEGYEIKYSKGDWNTKNIWCSLKIFKKEENDHFIKDYEFVTFSSAIKKRKWNS